MKTPTLSPIAQQLYSHLQTTGGAWLYKCVNSLFPPPIYPAKDDNENRAKKQAAYWQWEANLDGYPVERPVGEILVKFTATDNYSKKVSAAYQELRKAGLADESNNGFNEYYIYPTK